MKHFKAFITETRLVEVDVGTGYQQLHPGDTIARGDEWLYANSNASAQWTPFTSMAWGRKIPKDKIIPMLYRRKAPATTTEQVVAPTSPTPPPAAVKSSLFAKPLPPLTARKV